MLRGVSSTLNERVEVCGDKTVHCWKFNFDISTAGLIMFADEVKTVLGQKNYKICLNK